MQAAAEANSYQLVSAQQIDAQAATRVARYKTIHFATTLKAFILCSRLAGSESRRQFDVGRSRAWLVWPRDTIQQAAHTQVKEGPLAAELEVCVCAFLGSIGCVCSAESDAIKVCAV